MMDWAQTAEHYQRALIRIVAELFVLARIVPGERPESGYGIGQTSLPRYVYRAVMLILVPAEAALRRLIIVAAHAFALTEKAGPRRARQHAKGLQDDAQNTKRIRHGRTGFNMFDPMKRFEDYWRPEIEGFERRPFPLQLPEPQRFAPVNAVSLWHRINALNEVANNLPKAARRYARWKARLLYARTLNLPIRPRRISTMRPGFAPGWRRKWHHEVGDVLYECHILAQDILSPPKRTWLIETIPV